MQTKIPCVLMRGGTSKGPFFNAADLPGDPELRDQVLIAAMGSPDARQIDGVGGANPLTSKVAIVKPSERDGVDLDYLFVQVVVDEPRASIKQNCGNMLAGVGAFAVEQGMIEARGDETTLTVFMENSSSLADVTFATPGGHPEYDGDARIDGVPGTASPVMTNFRGTEGSTCGALLPTGNLVDTVNGIEVTCIDNGMPCVLFEAAAVGRTGYESRDELNADTELKERVEELRFAVGPMMNLEDVGSLTVPKMTLVAPPRNGGSITTRSFIPHDCHAAIGVFAAVSVATACIMEGSTASRVAVVPEGLRKMFSVEHPTGEMSVEMEFEGSADNPVIKRAALLRTARRLFEGQILVSDSVWKNA
ncbi:MAG: 4-oxalomesaconate tautomerase [Rhodospirillaceae bacterium]|jgi:4-oxalomesaconate tautomerase|nr:4-oxalomesaconate tautomerase [Rhodospirillaceae bacterium]MBT4671027.1 4-oxalomesaconate tautomerase [Rhodospirillaceae bacterium]MBT4720165.1 4-oxalomesaconate tautomerase [Rhodospirillaceae bacterium]MBT5838286.1 4-oxalomesaconate tautomerase [Rhodospirillaceae bacterium]MBT6291167.1 4-oxalomesaconate tautomerase [Rhodospirillaceae bacterium]